MSIGVLMGWWIRCEIVVRSKERNARKVWKELAVRVFLFRVVMDGCIYDVKKVRWMDAYEENPVGLINWIHRTLGLYYS